MEFVPLFVLAFIGFYLLSSIKVLAEYERGVVFRLGRLLSQPKGPGLAFVFSPLDRMARVSLRTVVLDVPPQDVITRDNVTISVNAVVYFRVLDPSKAICEVENYLYATSQLAQTTLRSVLGEQELDDLLANREQLNDRLQSILDHQTDPWGIKVSMVEVKGIDLPQDMQRAMSKQAEAERIKRAKVIHAQGEFQASQMLLEAAKKMSEEPTALQLRYLQTLTDIGVEKNTTIIFPLPMELMAAFTKLTDATSSHQSASEKKDQSHTNQLSLVDQKALPSGDVVAEEIVSEKVKDELPVK